MRPIIKLTLSPLDKILDKAAIILLVLLWVAAIYAFTTMPDTIPTHFNGSGAVDDYGSKATILILPLIATVLFGGLTLLNRYPHIFNYTTEITEANAERQYTLTTRMMRLMKVFILLLFTGIVVSTYLNTKGIIRGVGMWWLVPVEVLALGIPIAFALMMARNKKDS